MLNVCHTNVYVSTKLFQKKKLTGKEKGCFSSVWHLVFTLWRLIYFSLIFQRRISEESCVCKENPPGREKENKTHLKLGPLNAADTARWVAPRQFSAVDQLRVCQLICASFLHFLANLRPPWLMRRAV
jgi:hypothetical protein